MEGSYSGSSRAALSTWLAPTTRRSTYSTNHQTPASTTTEAPNPQRPVTSRRRRVLGRLVRSGSDPRTAAASASFNAEAPEFVPQSLPKTPSKRKASSSAKSGKAVQADSIMAFTNAATTEPPVFRSEDIMLPTKPGPSHGFTSQIHDILDSSDEDTDNYDVTVIHPFRPNRRPSGRLAAEMCSRLRMGSEAKKRQDNVHMISAVLIFPEWCSADWTVPVTGSDRLRYLPLCPASTSANRADHSNTSLLTVLPGHRDFAQRAQRMDAHSKAIWPLGELPVELFDLITTHLARDDVKTMRLVNREFEQKVSRSLFHTSVVPFNTEIYDMIDEDRKTINRAPLPHFKGKGKMKSPPRSLEDTFLGQEAGGLQWQNAKEDREGKVYKGHGLRVFRGFGPHIKRFGMSFEISEQQLAWPPTKKELDHIESYYGSYDWPSLDYARFATLAGLENVADETSRMKAAFANLEIVQELALSIDSGLGWLNGPDKSLHALIFDQSSPVFGSSFQTPDHNSKGAKEFWTALRQSQVSFDPHSNLKEMTLEYRASLSHPTDIDGLRDSIYSNTQLWSSIGMNKVTSALPNTPLGFGVLYTTANQPTLDANQKYSLMPGDLTKEQREWLLETQWAQQAFLESYMLAVIDNPSTFGNVTTLNIAKVSSRFLPMLAREIFWDGLPQLSEVILKVSPDWRTVEKDDAGFAQTSSKYPSEAMRVFHREILQTRVAPRQSIKRLTIGWVGGGEHAQGMFARNNNVLPAPITRLDHCTANSSIFGIAFNHVEHLTLSNCWITPPALEGLIRMHSNKALKKLTLDSVSLTAHPKFPNNVHGAGAHQFAQAMAVMHAQFANQAPAAALQQAGAHGHMIPAVPQQLNAQQMALMHQQLHQLQQQVANANQNAQLIPVNTLVQNNGTNTTATGSSSHWTSGHREGSWPHIVDLISPGAAFQDYLPAPQPWEEPFPTRPETTLRTIEFKSCGYVKLPNHTGFDQMPLDPPVIHRHAQSTWFRSRYNSLKGSMMATSDRNIGHIVQFMPLRELNALQFAWGLTEGWPDRAKAEEPEFDGLLSGGTGRFSGVVERGMPLVGSRGGSIRIDS